MSENKRGPGQPRKDNVTVTIRLPRTDVEVLTAEADRQSRTYQNLISKVVKGYVNEIK